MCTVLGIFVEWLNFCMRYIYWHDCIISAYEVIGIFGIHGHICCWHIYGYSMVKKQLYFIVPGHPVDYSEFT